MYVVPTQQAVQAPQSPLERQLIVDYLAEKGHRLPDLKNLPAEMSKKLMTEACVYASLRLAEIQARSQFRRAIRFED